MSRHGVLFLILGISVGANVVLGAWALTDRAAPQVALGQTVDQGGGYTVATGGLFAKPDSDALYIVSHAEKKLLVYFVDNKGLTLLHVRDFTNDLEPKQYGEQTPKAGKTTEAAEKGKAKE